MRLSIGRAAAAALAVLSLSSGAAGAQIAGVPLPAATNARSSRRILLTASVESGAYRHRAGWVVPIAARAGLDRGPVNLAAGAATLRSTDGARPHGISLGGSLALRLWSHGDTYGALGGRAVAGAVYSRFAPPGGNAVWQLDLPVALALVHRLPPPRFAILPWVAPRVQPRVRHDGTDRDVRLVVGGSAGVELAKAGCDPGTTCVTGWGIRLGLELVGDVGGGPLEGGVTLGAIWKFF